jgi:hypothetical protein
MGRRERRPTPIWRRPSGAGIAPSRPQAPHLLDEREITLSCLRTVRAVFLTGEGWTLSANSKPVGRYFPSTNMPYASLVRATTRIDVRSGPSSRARVTSA